MVFLLVFRRHLACISSPLEVINAYSMDGSGGMPIPVARRPSRPEMTSRAVDSLSQVLYRSAVENFRLVPQFDLFI